MNTPLLTNTSYDKPRQCICEMRADNAKSTLPAVCRGGEIRDRSDSTPPPARVPTLSTTGREVEIAASSDTH